MVVIDHALKLLGLIKSDQLKGPMSLMGGSTIGQQFRHIIEFYLILITALDTKLVCFDKRTRKPVMENDPDLIKEIFYQLKDILKKLNSDKKLQMEYGNSYSDNRYCEEKINTTLMRELHFVLEHSIHHLAIIKMALRSICPDINIDIEIGVAPSTLQQTGKCAH